MVVTLELLISTTKKKKQDICFIFWLNVSLILDVSLNEIFIVRLIFKILLKYCGNSEFVSRPNRIRTRTEPEPTPNYTKLNCVRIRVRFGQKSKLIWFGSVATQIRNFHSMFI